MKTQVVMFEYKKSTAGTHVFEETTEGAPVIQSLYVKKYACPAGTGPGTKLRLKIEIQEGGKEEFAS